MSQENKKNPTGELITLAIVITIIYLFLKYLGEFIGYIFILGGIAYLGYTLFSKGKTGKIFDLFERRYVDYSKKLMGFYTAVLTIGGLILIGLGSWLNPSYTYCECQQITADAISWTVLRGQYGSTAKFDEAGVDACNKKVIDALDLDVESGKMNVEFTQQVSYEICTDGYYKRSKDGAKITEDGGGKVTLVGSLQTLYKNIHYEYLGGRETELEEARKEDERLFGKPNQSVAPEQEIQKPAESPANTTEVQINLFEINDPDGYSNLRQSPGGAIMKKVMQGEKFEVIGTEKGYSKVKLADGTVGYIHQSRVVSAP